MQIKGQAALVTGAGSGIGADVARHLAAAGAKVALADIDEARLAEAEKELTAAGGTVVAIPLDITDPDQWTAAADRAEEALGPISILCNNAGANGGGALDEPGEGVAIGGRHAERNRSGGLPRCSATPPRCASASR